MIIGTINNYGEIKGQITDAQYVTGFISSAELMGGQIVGMRGMKGDKGDTGDTGAAGADGHTPVLTSSKVGKVTTVYADGTSLATLNDGNDGQDGTNGTDGQDGYSPSASVSKVGDTATITITDKGGTTTANVYDGELNVQSDWDEADNTKDDFIKNKPSIHNVPSGGTSGQVLSKSSNDDYALAWINQSAGGGEIPYCTCADSASTVAKTATVVNGSFTSLTTGAQVAVKFTYTNTATDPTMNVNSTGAKPLMRGGTSHVGTNANDSWRAGTVVILVYDGSGWQVANWLNTTYAGGTGAQIITGTEALNKVWSPQQIHDGITGLIPAEKIFIAEKDVTTYAEITAALNAGKTVFAKTSNSYSTFNLYTYAFDNGTSYYFYRQHGGAQVNMLNVDNTDTWSSGSTSLVTTADKPIVHEHFTLPSRSFPANAAYWFASNNIEVPTKTGYTAVGIVGGSSYSNYILVNPLISDSDPTKLYGFARNLHTSAVSTVIEFDVLYVKTDLL